MADVNFIDYGNNALRITDSAFDVIEFGSINGYELGVVIGLTIVLFLVVFGFVFVARQFNKLRKT